MTELLQGFALGMGVMLLLVRLVAFLRLSTQRRRNRFHAAVLAEVNRQEQVKNEWGWTDHDEAIRQGRAPRQFVPIKHP